MPIYQTAKELPSASAHGGTVVVVIPVEDLTTDDPVEIEMPLRHARTLSEYLKDAIEKAQRNVKN